MGRTVYRGYFPAFAFFFPTFAPLCLRASSPLAPPRRFHLLGEMASLAHPRHFQTEEELSTVRRLLGWSAQETIWGIRAGSVPLGNLRAGEFVLFISHISTGLGLPISSFFLLLLEDFGFQLQHLTPHSIQADGAPCSAPLRTGNGGDGQGMPFLCGRGEKSVRGSKGQGSSKAKGRKGWK